jgi:hypothetical protein
LSPVTVNTLVAALRMAVALLLASLSWVRSTISRAPVKPAMMPGRFAVLVICRVA